MSRPGPVTPQDDQADVELLEAPAATAGTSEPPAVARSGAHSGRSQGAEPGLTGDDLLAITRGTRRIETLLGERLGAEGRGLRGKADSVREHLHPDLHKRLRWVATMRNRTLHEDGFEPKDLPRLIDTLQDCAQALEEMPVPPTGEASGAADAAWATRHAVTDGAGGAGTPQPRGRGRARGDDAARSARRISLGAAVFVLLLVVLALSSAR